MDHRLRSWRGTVALLLASTTTAAFDVSTILTVDPSCNSQIDAINAAWGEAQTLAMKGGAAARTVRDAGKFNDENSDPIALMLNAHDVFGIDNYIGSSSGLSPDNKHLMDIIDPSFGVSEQLLRGQVATAMESFQLAKANTYLVCATGSDATAPWKQTTRAKDIDPRRGDAESTLDAFGYPYMYVIPTPDSGNYWTINNNKDGVQRRVAGAQKMGPYCARDVEAVTTYADQVQDSGYVNPVLVLTLCSDFFASGIRPSLPSSAGTGEVSIGSLWSRASVLVHESFHFPPFYFADNIYYAATDTQFNGPKEPYGIEAISALALDPSKFITRLERDRSDGTTEYVAGPAPPTNILPDAFAFFATMSNYPKQRWLLQDP